MGCGCGKKTTRTGAVNSAPVIPKLKSTTRVETAKNYQAATAVKRKSV